ncbi:MAG: protein kinase, partial [Planctomycetota bacterium]
MSSSSSELRSCPQCGETVPLGETHCPSGHLCVWDEASLADLSTDTDPFDSSELDSGFTGSEGGRPKKNGIFECRPCGRFVETQAYQGRVVVPAYCPWCGNLLESIVGRELDGYVIDEQISSGGFGAVYLASNSTQRSMKAVVKFLLPRVAYSRPDFVRHFIEEARFTESVGQTCWNIVRVSSVREKPWPYFFMEYVRGVTLEEFVEGYRKDTPIPISECVGYLRGVARALAATHARGRVHRDLKPLNIMVIQSKSIPSAEERIKMLDFGLAMKVGRGASVELGEASGGATTDSAVLGDSPVAQAGTPEYMAPETFEGITEFESDIYAFGVTAYEILTGERPWKEPSKGTARLQYWNHCHRFKRPRHLRELRPDVPNWVAKVVSECLEKDPSRRLPDAETLINRLRAPISRWVWVACAVGFLLMSFLVWDFFHPETNQLTGWNKREGDALTQLGVSPSDSSAFAAFVPDSPAGALELETSIQTKQHDWSSSAGEISTEEGKLRLLLSQEEQIPQTIEVRGESRSSVYVGRIDVIRDAVNPRILKPFYYWNFEDRAEPAQGTLTNGLTFRRGKVEFAVSVEDPSGERPFTTSGIERVDLVIDDGVVSIEGKESTKLSLAGGLRPAEGSRFFSLTKVPKGEHTAQFVARDLATNQFESPKFRFRIVEGLKVERRKPHLAGGRVVLPFQAEALSALEATVTAGRMTPRSSTAIKLDTVYRRTDKSTDVITDFRGLSPGSLDTAWVEVDLADIDSSTWHYALIDLPVDANGELSEDGEHVFLVELHFKDRALGGSNDTSRRF